VNRLEKLMMENPRSVTARVSEGVQSKAEPLGEKSRSFFEQRFGHDFGKVRIHRDARAAESADALQADAYTKGEDVVFGAGRYAPDSASGRALLAHELAHVVQQSGAPQVTGGVHLSRPEAATEQSADITAQRILGGLPAPSSVRTEPAMVHRTIKEDLRKAIAGWGTDEEAIYTRLGSASPDEKKEVMGDPVLMQELYDDLTRGEWGKVLGLLGATTESRVHAASEGWGTDEEGIYEALRATSATDLETQIEGTTLLLDLRDELSDKELGKALAIITEKFYFEGSITFEDTYHVLVLFPDAVKEAFDQFAALGYNVGPDLIAHLDRGHNMPPPTVADVNTHIANDNNLERVQAAFEARWNITSQAQAGTSGKAPQWTVALIRKLHAALQQLPPGHVTRADQDTPGMQKGEFSGFRLIPGSTGYWDKPFVEVGMEHGDVAGLTRHEVGHALDEYLGATTEGFKKNAVNGWDWMNSSIIWELHMTDPWKRKDGTQVPIADQLAINTVLDNYVQTTDGSQGLRAFAGAGHVIRTYWNDDVPMIEAAKDLAGKKDKVYESLGSVKKIGGRYYSWSTYYHEFYVYNAIVQEKRLTNYSLFGHPEFFAEMYEAYYQEGVGPKRGEKLKGVPNWKQFFDTVVHTTK
jgi:hypothetical protein